MPAAYNAIALSTVTKSLKNKGNPREIDVMATPGKCDSVCCSACQSYNIGVGMVVALVTIIGGFILMAILFSR